LASGSGGQRMYVQLLSMSALWAARLLSTSRQCSSHNPHARAEQDTELGENEDHGRDGAEPAESALELGHHANLSAMPRAVNTPGKRGSISALAGTGARSAPSATNNRLRLNRAGRSAATANGERRTANVIELWSKRLFRRRSKDALLWITSAFRCWLQRDLGPFRRSSHTRRSSAGLASWAPAPHRHETSRSTTVRTITRLALCANAGGAASVHVPRPPSLPRWIRDGHGDQAAGRIVARERAHGLT